MKRIYIPTTCAENWQQLLAEPGKQWKDGFSAKALADCWEVANPYFPAEISLLFDTCDFPYLRKLKFLLGFPEWKTYLPPRGHASQNDMFVIASDSAGGLVTMMVEGKVNEHFGPSMAEWSSPLTPGKKMRLEFIQSKLGFEGELPGSIRYQLLHRTVSAILEAERFHAKSTVMLVHSFSQADQWFGDYCAFLGLFGVTEPKINALYELRQTPGLDLYAAWVRGRIREDNDLEKSGINGINFIE